MQVYQIVKQLEETNSRLEKEAILEANKENDALKTWFKLCLDPHIQFYQRKIPSYKKDSGPTLEFFYAMELLSVFSDRVVTGKNAINRLATILAQLEPEDAAMIERIIEKDPKCGCNTSTVNKTWANLIPEFPCLLASAFDAKLAETYDWEQGIFAQLKSDGMRVNAICKDGKVELRSRNGKLIDTLDRFENLSVSFNGYVIDGELLVRGKDGKPLDRKTGNGICNKAAKGTISEAEADCLYIAAWDIVPIDKFYEERDETPYEVRFARLQSMLLLDNTQNVSLIPSKMLTSYKEAKQMYRELVAAGEEGILIKKPEMIWESKRSKDQMKFKEELECDLKVIGFNYGKKGSKNEKRIGSLQCRSSDDIIKVNVSGMTDAAREDYSVVGKIITVLFNSLTQDKTSGEYSLFLPRIIEVRNDKDTADSFDDVMKIVKSCEQGIN